MSKTGKEISFLRVLIAMAWADGTLLKFSHKEFIEAKLRYKRERDLHPP